MTDAESGIAAIIAHLKTCPQGVSVSEMAETLHINRNTVARYLDKLLVSGRVEMRSFGKAKVFYLSRRVPVSAMLNLSSEMVLMVDAGLQVIQANSAVAAFLNCSADDLIGKPVYAGYAGRICPDNVADLLRSGLQGDAVHEEIVVEAPSGPCILDLRIYPIVLPDGNRGATLLLEDITAQVKAEAAVAENEAMFRRIVETVQDVLWSVDANGILTYISPGISRVTGDTPESLLGKPLQSLIAPREAERVSAAMFADRAKQNGFTLHEIPVIGGDGRRHFCDFTASPLRSEDESGEFLGFSGALHDISGRYEAEQGEKRWRLFMDAVMENIPAAIMASDLKTGQCYYVNREAERFFRFSRSELMHMTIQEILDDLGSDVLRASLQESMDRREKIMVSAIVQRGKKETQVSARFVPMKLSADLEYIISIFFAE